MADAYQRETGSVIAATLGVSCTKLYRVLAEGMTETQRLTDARPNLQVVVAGAGLAGLTARGISTNAGFRCGQRPAVLLSVSRFAALSFSTVCSLACACFAWQALRFCWELPSGSVAGPASTPGTPATAGPHPVSPAPPSLTGP